jgi:hypothetical protein
MRDPETRRQTNVEVEELRGHRVDSPLRIGTVVVTEYRRRSRWRPSPLSHSQGVLEMLGHTVAARREPRRVLDHQEDLESPALAGER